jgi:hypothetical protein
MQYVLGSPWHPGTAISSAHAMVHAALVSEKLIAPPEVSPAPTFEIVARRWRKPSVGLREVDRWREAGDISLEQVEHCEAIRREYKEREGRS